MTVLEKQIATLASAMAPAGGTAQLDDTFRGSLGYTSLRFLELTIAVERALGLQPLTPESLAGVLTVGDLVRLVEARQGRS